MTDGRAKIVQALKDAGVSTVLFNQFEVPKNLPAAVVVLESETGIRATARQYTATDVGFTVYLIVNATKAIDPDSDLYELKEAFRAKYVAALNRDFPRVEYYPSRTDGAREVRIAKIDLLKSGQGAAS